LMLIVLRTPPNQVIHNVTLAWVVGKVKKGQQGSPSHHILPKSAVSTFPAKSLLQHGMARYTDKKAVPPILAERLFCVTYFTVS